MPPDSILGIGRITCLFPSVATWLRLLDDLGLLCLVIPELADARGVTQPKEHHWDVFDHSIETATEFNHEHNDAQITLPYLVDDALIDGLVK